MWLLTAQRWPSKMKVEQPGDQVTGIDNHSTALCGGFPWTRGPVCVCHLTSHD